MPGKKIMINCKKLGLVGKIILGTGVVASLFSGNAKADQLYIDFSNKLGLEIEHTSEAIESFDGHDSPFNTGSGVDIYSAVDFNPYKLWIDSRPSDSMSTIHTEIIGSGLSGTVNNSLVFSMEDLYEENNFTNKNIFADLYTSTGSLVGTYDVKYAAANGQPIPLTISNGLSYTMNVRFEPNTFTFEDLATFADNWLQMCDVSNNKCGGFGEEGQCLNFIDFAYWANIWNPN